MCASYISIHSHTCPSRARTANARCTSIDATKQSGRFVGRMCRASLKRGKPTSVRKTKTRNEFAERSHATAARAEQAAAQQIFFMKVNLHFPTRLADCCLAAKLAHIEEWPCCVRQSINLWHGKFMALRAIECVWNIHIHTLPHTTQSVQSRWQTNKKKMTSRFYGVPYPYVSQLPEVSNNSGCQK